MYIKTPKVTLPTNSSTFFRKENCKAAPPTHTNARTLLCSAYDYSAHMLHMPTVSPYDPNADFCASVVERLDAVGFNVCASLAGLHKEFNGAVARPDPLPLDFNYWLRFRRNFRRPPTWKTFLDVLKELGLAELSQQIDEYLSDGKLLKSASYYTLRWPKISTNCSTIPSHCSGVPSLRELSMAVIMSGLLQQRLEPDQLHTRLPDYVPTTLRNSILQGLKARTLWLVPFPDPSPSPSSSTEDLTILASSGAEESHAHIAPELSDDEGLVPEPKQMKFM